MIPFCEKWMRAGFYAGILHFLFVCLMSHPAWTQEGDAGVENPFGIGEDARALGLGNAAVAFPQDPSAFLWNPAGMVVVQQKSLLLSYTTLFEGVQYQALNYTHPTLSAGTFGFGISRIGIGGIRQMDFENNVPVDLGEIDYWWGRLTLAYGATVFRGFSLGANFTVHRQVLGNASCFGFGMDAGFHYQFHRDGSMLNNLYFGGAMTNAVPARLRLGTRFETMPYAYRLGSAKLFYLRDRSDRWLFAADMEKNQFSKPKWHFGTEYAFQNCVFARAGLDDGNATFGGGIRLRYFQIDYATGRFGDPAFFPRSHRFSLILFIGKSISEQRRVIEARRQREVQKKIEQEMEEARQNRIQAGLKAGKDYFAGGDYFKARLEFGSVLKEDPENQEAKQLLAETDKQEQEIQKAREQQLLNETRENEAKQKDLAFVHKCFQEGLAFLDKGAYLKAIERWNQALERDPANSQIQNYIARAKDILETEVHKLLARARQLMRQENASEAYPVLQQAKEMAGDYPKLSDEISAEMKNLDEKFGFLNAYQAGVQRYEQKDYASSAQFFQRALELNPNNDKIKELYRNARARAQGLTKEMSRDTKEKYTEGLRLYQQEKYQEAVRIWEEALQSDPNNIKILEAIEGAKARIEEFNKAK
jgi:tetratricopeptide (TPR) repeat protein